jgi:hypothetical protein
VEIVSRQMTVEVLVGIHRMPLRDRTGAEVEVQHALEAVVMGLIPLELISAMLSQASVKQFKNLLHCVRT